jgi:protocatechuate 3,4-dioxygenase beta subunit
MLWLLLLALATGAPQSAPRDAPANPAGPVAVIRGRVTAAATGQPLHRVRVTVNAASPNPPTGVTDTRGVFEIVNVPAGTYAITASRAGYLTVQYGQRRPREAGRTLRVRDGETIEGLDIALVRGGVLSGRISDETGDVYPGARVEAIEQRYIRGRRIPIAARVTFTNDAGEFRLSGLESGAYQIRASSTDVWESDDGKAAYVHAVTYFPGVTGGDRPDTINVTAGQEVSSLDVRLIAGAAARVTGLVRDANGEPMAGQAVNLDRITRTTGGALQSAGRGGLTKTDARGAFEFTNLAAGEYLAYAGAPSQSATATVIVSDGEVRQVTLVPGRPAAVTGSIVTDEGAPPPFPAARLAIDPVAADPQSVLPAWGSARAQSAKPDWTFRADSLDGAYFFRVTGLPEDWMLKGVLLGGRDIIDQPLAMAKGQPDVSGVQIVLSRKGAKVTGQVADATGAPAPDTTVILFAENSAAWGVASRFIRAVRPDGVGRFSIAGLAAGVYRVAARDVVIDGQWEDPEFLQSLVKDAVRIELAEGASETVKLVPGPPR